MGGMFCTRWVAGALAGLAALGLGGCVTKPKWEPLPTKVSTQVFDEHGWPTDGTLEAQRYRILGLGPRPVDDPLARLQDPEQQGRQKRAHRPKWVTVSCESVF